MSFYYSENSRGRGNPWATDQSVYGRLQTLFLVHKK